MTLLRRFLVLVALMFWQGGFTFYAGVVVPIGRDVLGGGLQSEVTRPVAGYLNLAAAVALVLLAWDTVVISTHRRTRGAVWLGMAGCQALLFALHPLLGRMLDNSMPDVGAFRYAHRWYLWTCTVQWGLAVGYVAMMLGAWRAEDRQGA
jgi:hypothetical protein